MTTSQARFREIDAIIKRQQKNLEAHAKQSADRLSTIERQLHRFDALDKKIDAVAEQVKTASGIQTEMTESVRNQIKQQSMEMNTKQSAYQEHCDGQIATLGENVIQAMNGIMQVRSELAKLSKMMIKDLANRPSPGPKRRKQRMTEGQDMFDDPLPGVFLQDQMQIDETEETN